MNSWVAHLKICPIQKNPYLKNILIIMQSECFNILSDIDFTKYPFTEFHIKLHPSEDTDQYSFLKKFENAKSCFRVVMYFINTCQAMMMLLDFIEML